MASRFWGGSSSEEEDSDHSDASDVEMKTVKTSASRWAIDSDSDSEDEVRVVRSAKDKAFSHMEKSCLMLTNAIKINDWSTILSEFDPLMKQCEKAKNVISQQGFPTFFLKMMCALDDCMQATMGDKPAQKKMSKENSKSFIRMKGKVKKQVAIMNKVLTAYRENPHESEVEESSSEEESDEDSDSDSDESVDVSDNDVNKDAHKEANDSDDDSDDGSDEEKVSGTVTERRGW